MIDTWNEYNQVRVAGDKKTANSLLSDFIGLLKQKDKKEINAFVDNICSLILDVDDEIIPNNGTEVSNNELRIQHPLFKEIILPILKEQYKKGSAKHIKWIGQLEQFFYSDNSMTNIFLRELDITGYFQARHFFEKSFAIDNNQKTLTLLLHRIAQDINYYTHEVPIDVLVHPDVLDKELTTFRQYWQKSETKNIWVTAFAEWELIAKHWSLYVGSKAHHDNFESYLKTNGIQFD